VVFFIITLGVSSGVFGGRALLPFIQGPKVSVPPPSIISEPEFKELEVEYLSNEILIKLKPQAKNQIRSTATAFNTGISSLNKLNQDYQVTNFEKIAKDGKKSKKDHEVFRWYKIILPGKKEIIKEKFSDIKKSSIVNLTEESLQEQSKGAKIKGILEKYKQDPNIETVQLNYLVHATVVPNDPYYSSSGSWGQPYDDLWGLKKIETEKSWSISTGSDQIVAAVIDTGVDYNHPDIQKNIWINKGEIPGNSIDDDGNGYVDDYYGYDFSNYDSDPMDDMGHGTHVAGTIGAVGNNNLGVVGVNWNVKIMSVKFLSAEGVGWTADAIKAVIYATDNGAKVINNSWGGLTFGSGAASAINYAHSNGVTVVSAAGNNSADARFIEPGNIATSITVASTDRNDNFSDFSNFGPKIDVAAPGGDSTIKDDPNKTYANILSLRASSTDMYGDGVNIVGSEYYRARGTSMASPYVAGLAALILSRHPDWGPEEVRQVIRQSADKITGKEFDQNIGYGRINAFKALNIPQAPPAAKITKPIQAYDIMCTMRATEPNACPDAIHSGEEIINFYGFAYSQSMSISYQLEYGFGSNPSAWKVFISGSSNINGERLLGSLNTSILNQTGQYFIRLTVIDSSGNVSTDIMPILVDVDLVKGWPMPIYPLYKTGPSIVSFDPASSKVAFGSNDDKLYLLDYHGDPLSGWPVNIGGSQAQESSDAPVAVDLNNDGKDEIISTTLGLSVTVFKEGGTMMPGWPYVIGKDPSKKESILSHVAIGDVNNDGDKELVVSRVSLTRTFDDNGNIKYIDSSTSMYILDKQGNLLYTWDVENCSGSPDNKEKRCGLNNAQYFYFTPSLSDIDQDGDLEIFIERGTRIYAYHHTGSTVSGWPQIMDSDSIAPVVALGDVNGDRKVEIVAFAKIADFVSQEKTPLTLYVWQADGIMISGWPKTFSIPFNISPTQPILADFDNNGAQEIVVSFGSEIHILKGDGTELSDWPLNLPNQYIYKGSLTVTDINYDDFPEVLVSTEPTDIPWGTPFEPISSKLLIVNSKKNIVWQKAYFHHTGRPQNLFTDLNHDGIIEVLAPGDYCFPPELGGLYCTSGGSLYLFKITNIQKNSTPDDNINRISWKMFQQDARHSGAYTGNLKLDSDGDGVTDTVDNCPFVPNPDQKNSDALAFDNGPGIPGDDKTVPNSDNLGDACDPDDDNDGLLDVDEEPLNNCGAFNDLAANHPNPSRDDVTNDDNHNGNPAPNMGRDSLDNGPSWDTDNDGVLDGAECQLGFNPRNKASRPSVNNCATYLSNLFGSNITRTTDTDGDGLLDVWEFCGWGTDPKKVDTDNDGKGDCKEAADVDGNGIVDYDGDAMYYAKAALWPTSEFGKTMDFDIDKNGILDYIGDVIYEVKFSQGVLPCQ